MVDITTIEDTLEELVNDAPTTFETCEKIAHLTITRDLLKSRLNRTREGSERVLNELHDILPSYSKYVDTKKRYQQYEVVEQMVVIAMQNLCDEIADFIITLYRNTESEAEREAIENMIDEVRSAI